MVFPWETKTKTGSTIRKLYRRVSHAFEGMVFGIRTRASRIQLNSNDPKPQHTLQPPQNTLQPPQNCYYYIKSERSQTATQGVINPARGALWLKLILNPASSKPVLIDCLTHPTRPTQRYHLPLQTNALHQSSPLSPVGHGHEVDAAAPP